MITPIYEKKQCSGSNNFPNFILTLDKWQSVLVDFSEKAASTEFSRIVFQVNGENNNDNVTAYVDDFYYEVPQAHDDFEGNGNIPAWAEDAAGMSTVDNPYKEFVGHGRERPT